MLTLILLVFAFVLFTISGIGIAAGRFNLVAIGLALWVLAEILGRGLHVG